MCSYTLCQYHKPGNDSPIADDQETGTRAPTCTVDFFFCRKKKKKEEIWSTWSRLIDQKRTSENGEDVSASNPINLSRYCPAVALSSGQTL